MFILIHVIIAFISIVVASIALFSPSMKKLVVSYGFMLATVATGTILLVTIPSQILHTCVTGLTYLTVVSIITIASHVRLRRKELAYETLEE
jgi:hypothetical protein